MKIVIDSYAWVEHLLGTEKGRRADSILKEADALYTPDTVLAEVARKFVREGIDVDTVNEWLSEIVGASTIVCLDAGVAIDAAQCYLMLEENAKKAKLSHPSLFDAILLALSRSLDSKVLTGDQHFKNLPETLWLE